MSVVEVKDQICRYFGGDYVPASHAYLSPTVPGLGAVRRGRGKRANKRDLYAGLDTETHGSTMLVHLGAGTDRRIAIAGAANGIRRVAYEVVLHVLLHSTARHAEDAQDGFDQLVDAILARIHADHTLGSGGFEQGGFQVGEGESPDISWEMDLAETGATVTRGYLVVSFDAVHHIRA